jgi:hypothetical protein
MSWHGGTALAGNTCKLLIQQYKDRRITADVAQEILTVVIGELRALDWGDPEEVLHTYSEFSFVVGAFANNNIFTNLCDECGQDLDDHCENCDDCECDGECQEDEEAEDTTKKES